MKNLSRDEAAERAALLRVEAYEVRLDLTTAPSASRFGAGARGLRIGSAEENRVGSISTRRTSAYRLTTQTSNSSA